MRTRLCLSGGARLAHPADGGLPPPQTALAAHLTPSIMATTILSTIIELYVSLGPVDDTLTRETRPVRVGVCASVCAFASDPKSREHISPCSP
jgi:hypothetical protein